MNMDHVSNNRFILFLQQELVRRINDNPKYSLRAFSGACGVSPGALSAILSRKRKLTSQTKEKISNALGISLENYVWLQDDSEILPRDQFATISEWYHFAILELIKLKSFQGNTSWIAKKLDLNIKEVDIAVERLKRLKLLKIENGKWIDTYHDQFLTNFDGISTSQAQRNMQKQVLQKSIRSLENDPLEERSHTSITLAIAKKDMTKAKKIIREFEQQLIEMLETEPEPDEVYNLSIGFYSLTKNIRSEK